MGFTELVNDYLHRVAVGPFDPPTTTLVGSDMVLHLPVLEYYASLCHRVTEFGVRNGHSTVAFLSGCRGEVISYDIAETPFVEVLRKMPLPCLWQFHQASTVDPHLSVEETDFLFFDTLHTYDHLKEELRLHGRKARQYLGFHDTLTCGEKDLSGVDPTARGILPAIHEFIASYPGEYQLVYQTHRCNGLMIFARV